VTWDPPVPATGRFANGIFSPTAQDAGKWFTFKVTSVKNPALFAQCRIYVPEMNKTAVLGADNSYYVYATAVNDNVYQKVNTDGTLGALVCPVTDGAPGAANDRTNVVAKNGANYLDDGGGYFYAKGADGKLGTADDKMMYDNAGTLVPAPYIPAGATSFTDRTGVTWRILKDNRPVAGTPTSFMTEDGSIETSDGTGTMLLLTDRVYSHGDSLVWGGYNAFYNTTNVFTTYDQSNGIYRPAMNLWYTHFVSPELKELARIPTLTYEDDEIMTTGWSGDTMNMDTAISTPGALAGVATTDGVVFPLSISEVTRYLGTVWAQRIANDSAGGGEPGYPGWGWQLRSPGYSAANPASGVYTNGSIISYIANGYSSLRPGLWIDTTPTP
jgi:hypothetical protein